MYILDNQWSLGNAFFLYTSLQEKIQFSASAKQQIMRLSGSLLNSRVTLE